MRHRFLTWALVVSIAVHFLAAGIVGRTFASKLSSAPGVDKPLEHLVKVDLVRSPDDEPVPKPPEPKIEASAPTVPESLASILPQPVKSNANNLRPRPASPSVSPRPHNGQDQGNPGGELNTGTPSTGGDIPGTWTNGKTPVGWVPGSPGGSGAGSGTGSGVGQPEPDPDASSGPNTTPNPPPPPPPPPPKTIRVKVCQVSGLLPNKYCEHTVTKTFVEGKQPKRVCDRCKAPVQHNSQLADRKNPQLIKSVTPVIPLSVPEGLSLRVKVQYTVTESGSVTGVKVVDSSGNRAVDNAVVKAASQLKYKPAVQNGQPRSVMMTRTYEINT